MVEREDYSIYLQKYSYDCAAGAVGIVLRNFGEKVNHYNLMQALDIRRSGTGPGRLEEYFRRRGFSVFSQENSSVAELKRQSNKGRLSIVLYQGSGTKREMASYKSGHYSVVAGVTSRYVYLLDPGVAQDYGQGVGWQVISVTDFRNRWLDRWKEKGKNVYMQGWMLAVSRLRTRRL